MSRRNHRAEFEQYLELSGFQREARFHPTRMWRFDFAHPDHRIAVEYDGFVGGSHGHGDASHASIGGLLRDQEKSNEAQLLGWIVIRVSAKTVKDETAYRWVHEALKLREAA